MGEDIVVNKEMGITHREFFRNVRRALAGGGLIRLDDRVIMARDGKSLEIVISRQVERRIAMFVLPVTNVTLTFRGYDGDGAARVVEAFDRAFQRGGG